MGLPALLHVDEDDGGVAPSLSEEQEAECARLWGEARTVWETHPREDDAEEERALAATFELLLTFASASGPGGRAGHAESALRRILEEERASNDLGRSFALRQLERALDRYGKYLAAVEPFKDVPEGALDTIEMHDEPLPRELRPLYRAVGAVFMAFDALAEGNDAALRVWARHADVRWREVDAALPQLIDTMRAARAQLDARVAWDGWTDEDRAHERESWKTLLPK